MKVCILTLGCKTNLAESDDLKRRLLSKGHEIVDLKDKPNICIINTCSVTAKSDYQSRQLIRRALKTGAKVMVTGCYAQLDEDRIQDISSEIEIFKNDEKSLLLDKIIDDSESTAIKITDRSRPFVKIQEGCSHKCTYCIIPALRGRPKSRPPEDIIDEILDYERAGYDEVVLTGIHIGLYGVDLKDGMNLTGLIEQIVLKTNRARIRLSSLEVIEIDKRFLEVFSEKRICKHLHIPLQSGSEGVLKRMKRPYNTIRYERKVKEIYDRFDNISLGTDVIVGFPGETEEEFEETLRFLKKLPINYMHVFPYSDRPGTEASKMPDKVPNNVKRNRAKRLRELDESKRSEYRKAQIGRTLEVLQESLTEEGKIKGKSENYLDVIFEKKDFEPGRITKVKIYDASGEILSGKAV